MLFVVGLVLVGIFLPRLPVLLAFFSLSFISEREVKREAVEGH